MVLKHLGQLIPAFAAELDKEAGITDDLKKGTKKLVSALKSVPEQANKAGLRAAARVHSLPHGDKVMAHGPDLLRKLMT